jgi:peptidoglycan/LPS O-acetylase OafA/YrhL
MNRITHLETLRGLMACWVFICHAVSFSLRGIDFGHFSSIMRLAPNGHEAVEVFIILSGFVIFLVLDVKREGYREFIVKRFFRLYPVFVVTFILAFFLCPFIIKDVLEVLPWRNTNGFYDKMIWQYNDYMDHSFFHAVAHSTMLHGIIPDVVVHNAPGAFLGPAWSISLEWQFYLIAPVLYLACIQHSKKRIAHILIFILLAAWASFQFYNPLGFGNAFLPVSFIYFFGGGVSYILYKYLKEKSIRISLIHLMLIVGGSAIISGLDKTIIIWMSFFVLSFMKSDGFFESKLLFFVNLKVFRFLGNISYSVYLWHMIILWIIQIVILKMQIYDPTTHLKIYILVGFPLVVLVSYLSYKFIELRGMKLAKKFLARS